MTKKKKIILIAFILMASVLLSGCTDSPVKEENTGIDKIVEPEKITVPEKVMMAPVEEKDNGTEKNKVPDVPVSTPEVIVARKGSGGSSSTSVHRPDYSVVKIATSNVVKDDSFFDYYVGIFSKLSNFPLMQMDPTGSLVGLAAERYEVSNNNTQWTFFIKDDLYWSDGEKVTPEDAEFTIRYTGAKINSAKWINDTLVDSSVSKKDNSVTFVFNKPYTTLNLEFTSYNMLPKHIWEGISDPNTHKSRGPYVGCGPYYLDDIDRNSGKLTYKKNPHWKGTSPKFESLEVHWFANDNVASFALQNGDADTYYKYASSYPYANIAPLEATGNFKLDKRTSIGLTYLGMNLKNEPFTDKQFRQALSYAIDYDELIRINTLGYGKVPFRGFVPPGMDHYKKTDALTYDVNEAKSRLDGAGYTDTNNNGIREMNGTDITLDLVIRPGYEESSRLMKEYLEAVGIGVKITQVETSVWYGRKDNYQYDLTISGATPWGMLMHAGWGSGYLDSRRSGQGVLHILDDPKFLTLCDDMLATTDQTKLKEYAYELQDYYAEEMPLIPLYYVEHVTPYNKRFSGWTYNPLFGIYNLDTFLALDRV